MVFLTPKIMQRTALFVTFGGFVTSLMTMFIPFWKTMNSDLNEMENWFSGLFHMCLYTEEVGIQCKAYESILALPTDLQISRVLMSLSIGTGAFAMVTAFLGLDGVDAFAGQSGLKRGLLIFSGVLAWISGLTTLAPISLVAYTTVVEFWDEGFPDVMPRWEYGEAMFAGWFGGFALVIGGTLFFIAVCMADFDLRTVPGSPLVNHRTQNYLKTEVL
ncbi:putative claudin-24 [Eucyclogobius newberryi]|uniref:putative claudin-24 n=1 Tax=Eucyclogobius newberryi TaxID=166745 RepID=UPI003B59F50F